MGRQGGVRSLSAPARLLEQQEPQQAARRSTQAQHVHKAGKGAAHTQRTQRTALAPLAAVAPQLTVPPSMCSGMSPSGARSVAVLPPSLRQLGGPGHVLIWAREMQV